MTTTHSLRKVLKKQASIIAKKIKMIERGELTDDPQGRFAEALKKGSVAFGIIMDDKVIKIEMTTEFIKATSEDELVALILKTMRETMRRDKSATVH
jgi:hypothetical protein